jgi:MFS family permease
LKPRPKFFYGWVVVAVGFVIMAVGYALRNSFSVFYPAIVDSFGWGRGNTALIFSIQMLVYGAVSPVVGRLVDRIEPRVVLSVGACLMGGGMALCSLATTQWEFYLLFGVMLAIGLSMVGITPLGAIVSNWFVRKRGLVFGILAAGFGVSLISAPVAQSLISDFGWRNAYAIIGLFSIPLLLPLCILFMRRRPQDKGLLPDGAVQASSGPQSLHELPGAGNFDRKWAGTTWTLGRALRTSQFWFLFVIFFFAMGIGETVAITHQVYFFRDVGYEPMQAAAIYSVFGIAFAAGNLCGYFSDRLGREKVFISGCLLSAGAVSLLFLISDASQPWMPFLFAICLGIGWGVAAPTLLATVADLFQGKNFGSIMGCMILGFSAGGAVAPWLAGMLHDRTGNYLVTFLMLLGCFAVSAALMWLIAPRKIRPVPRWGRTVDGAVL